MCIHGNLMKEPKGCQPRDRQMCGIKQSGLKLRFCTNESQKSRDKFVGLLRRLGFDISVNEITSPAPAARQILKERGLRPYLLVHDDVRSEFEGMDTSDPNCVVIGDAGDGFSYQSMNEAFRVLINLENPVLLSLGKGRYYKETDGLMLDVGPYMRALEYACDIHAEVVGKPAPEFFRAALKEMGTEAHETLMIGDDIVGDVGGARCCGMRALQVRTGKFRCDLSPSTSADCSPCILCASFPCTPINQML
uniref:Phospholysine phosphohistidine inorganic pyrophosphate phosphatase n=1 Tax=Sarcophilus harrisii TaxID=9305 RepID=A0A7N4PJF5_SARHA